jgi:hypothetical protein
MGHPGSAKHAKVEAEKDGVSVMLLGIVESNNLLPMLAGKGKCS